eukprot:7068373-Pyramimonas_sp.AAC.1
MLAHWQPKAGVRRDVIRRVSEASKRSATIEQSCITSAALRKLRGKFWGAQSTVNAWLRMALARLL